MNADERKRQLDHLKILAHREAENIPLLRRFLPLPSHGLALRPECVVVRGGRGAGKSALFGVLRALSNSAQMRRFFGDNTLPDAKWLDAFSDAMPHPSIPTLDTLAAQVGDSGLRAFWMVHLLARINEVLPSPIAWPQAIATARQGHENEPAVWLAIAEANLGAVSASLDQAERLLASTGTIVFASYDHLDRIGPFNRDTRQRYVSALLSLWLSLSNRYRHLRAKIFLREDLFEEGEHGFPDASKLRPRSVSLEWDVSSLYRVVVRHMVDLSAEMRGWLEGIKGLELEEDLEFGWIPGEMPEKVQKAFADRLAGELMGKGVRKGYTYRWIPNRLQDAQVRIVPRSILCLLGFAAEHATKRPLSKGTRLLLPQDLQAALEPTSKARVGEIQEEYPLVKRLENLRGLHVLLEKADVIKRLAAPVTAKDRPVDGDAVFDELVRLGVLKIRDNGKIDVPDIYRYGYGILRKGGVARPD